MNDHAFSRVAVTVLGIIGAGFLTAAPSARGVINGFADTGNAYSSVGRMIFTVVAPNPRGFPIGTILNSCTVTLIEPDVALTAGHCVASHAQNGQPPWLRAVVTFDADDSLDESKWIDFAETAVHPTLPHCIGPCPGDGGDPGVQDTGLIFLPRISGIAPSKLAPRNTLHAVQRLQSIFAVNVPMTFAGYGTTDYNGGNFEFLELAPHRHLYLRPGFRTNSGRPGTRGPAAAATGIPAGQSSCTWARSRRIVATISDAGDTCTEEETHARVDTKYVQDWIEDTIAAHNPAHSDDAAVRTVAATLIRWSRLGTRGRNGGEVH